MDAWSFDVCNYYDEGVDHVGLLNSSSGQLDELNMNMGSMDSVFPIPNQPSLPLINRTSSAESSSSNYMMTGHGQLMQPASPALPVNKHCCGARFPFPATEEMAITRALLSVISSSPPSSTSCMHQSCQPVSAFQPYSSSIYPAMESRKIAASQNMIRRAHSMLRNVNLVKTEGKTEELRPSSYQKQNLASEQRRRERLNAGFHSLWQLLPPGSKKDKTSVLCKTVGYMKALRAEIYELEEKNRIIEEQVLSSIEMVEVLVTKSEESSESQLIDLLVKVRAQCDLARVVLQVLECIKEMGAISLLWLDASPSSQEMSLLVTLRLAIKESTWEERSFREVITRAALMAVNVSG